MTRQLGVSERGSILMAVGGAAMVTSLALPWASSVPEGTRFSAFTMSSVSARSQIRIFPTILLVGGFIAIALAFSSLRARRLSATAGMALALISSYTLALTTGMALAFQTQGSSDSAAACGPGLRSGIHRGRDVYIHDRRSRSLLMYAMPASVTDSPSWGAG